MFMTSLGETCVCRGPLHENFPFERVVLPKTKINPPNISLQKNSRENTKCNEHHVDFTITIDTSTYETDNYFQWYDDYI